MLTIYHNPKCSKGRATLELLGVKKGLIPEVVKYLETPLKADELEAITKKLGLKARDIVRTKEEEFKALDLDLENEAKVFEAIENTPKLMERPIVVNGGKAKIGRPPEKACWKFYR